MKSKVFLLAVSALSIITLTACSTTTSSSGESDFFSEASQVNEDVKDSVKEFAPSESTSSSEIASNSSSTADSTINDFNPSDTSDATIESIVTYNDYLKMFEVIVNEYISNYEAVVSQYGLGDAESYQSMRDNVTESLEAQREAYGNMRNAKIIGKDGIVEYLKNYRDSLKEYTDNLATSLQ